MRWLREVGGRLGRYMEVAGGCRTSSLREVIVIAQKGRISVNIAVRALKFEDKKA